MSSHTHGTKERDTTTIEERINKMPTFSLLLSFFDVLYTLLTGPQSSAVVLWAVLYSRDGQTDRQLGFLTTNISQGHVTMGTDTSNTSKSPQLS